jgi:hypothetical protein
MFALAILAEVVPGGSALWSAGSQQTRHHAGNPGFARRHRGLSPDISEHRLRLRHQ